MNRVSRGIHLIVTKECLDDRENAMLNAALRWAGGPGPPENKSETLIKNKIHRQ
jgi:hypothetical protein